VTETIVVWFSCGAASAVAAKLTALQHGDTHNVRIVNNPIKEEHPDNQRFLKDVEEWVGLPIEFAVNPKRPNCSTEEVWETRKWMSGPLGAPCTMELKKEARVHFEQSNKIDWHVLGFTLEEASRSNRFIQFERSNLLPVLIENGFTKQDCFDYVAKAGLKLPEMYELGYPNANCIGCVKSASPTYWNHVRKVHPDVFERRATQSREIGTKLVIQKGKRVFLDELDPNLKGYKMKNLKSPECGIFCEE
jgi:3'-phosphoadenosine 5'-phosphosulfate sulfotransferase (PAPS reductase)/FAD synthetase